MSRICQLTGLRRMKKNSISIERSQITKRFPGFANVNLQIKTFKTQEFGNIRLRIANRTHRTIEKLGSLQNFLTLSKRGSLTEEALKMRNILLKKGYSYIKEEAKNKIKKPITRSKRLEKKLAKK